MLFSPSSALKARLDAVVPAIRDVLAIHSVQQQNAAMGRAITIRDVPDETTDELAARAALTGRSLQEYLRTRLIQIAASPDAEALVARIQARKASTGRSVSRERILQHRDADRR